ncbi:MAG: T9SS type A sorting domain-containing protein [bacterium]|nr:T9SS type A sorting domain-containing protein [bacterium]
MAQFLRISLVLLAAGIASQAAWAWPDDPLVNLAICTHAGEQTVPKIAATSDGGCYIGWQDNMSGNYDIYLQRLNGDGVPQWAENGLLISDHPQESWITDWDLTVDGEDHCLIAINDIRRGGDWDIYGYRISPAGEFVWGADGIVISDNANFEAEPRVVAASGGSVVFAWSEESGTGNVANLRKVTAAGADAWTPATITLTGTYGITIPRIAPCASDGVILQYLVPQGSGMYAQRYIYAQKYDSLGQPQWTAGGVLISNAGGISAWMKPDLIADGADGMFSFWYDTHDQLRHHVYVQHVDAAGTPLWTPNGVQTSLSSEELQMSHALAPLADVGGVIVFYQVTNLGQTENGLGGQRISAAGERLWGANGINFRPLGSPQTVGASVLPQEDGAILVFNESTEGSSNKLIRALRVDLTGDAMWEGTFRELSTVQSDKLGLVAAVNSSDQVLAVWRDDRSNAGDIYLQNVNPDGTLGDLIPSNPPSIMITSPEDSVTWYSNDTTRIILRYDIENFVVMSQGGDGLVHVNVRTQFGTEEDHYVAEPDSVDISDGFGLLYDWNTVTVELVDYDHLPLDPPVLDSVHIQLIEVAADDLPDLLPKSVSLLPAYPNPFNPTTTVRFALPAVQTVRLTVYNALGQEVALLAEGVFSTGVHETVFDASGFASGMYVCRLSAGEFSQERTLLLTR